MPVDKNKREINVGDIMVVEDDSDGGCHRGTIIKIFETNHDGSEFDVAAKYGSFSNYGRYGYIAKKLRHADPFERLLYKKNKRYSVMSTRKCYENNN